MSGPLFPGFERHQLPGDGITVDALVGGDGPALLLLHGYPQTRSCWHAVAPLLARQFTVVCPDLRGYGRSDKPSGDAGHALYSKRRMAQDQIATMAALGHRRFAVAGHDRGGRVAYRLALDHPEKVNALAVLDIIPTAEAWAGMHAEQAIGAYHWAFLAQKAPLPERLIGADPEFFLRWTLASWAAKGFVFDAAALADYIACFRDPASIHGTCEDYRAGAGIDRADDEADRDRRSIAAPLLVLWAEQYRVAGQGPLDTWRRWANAVRGEALPTGHFLAEEAPAAVARALAAFLTEIGTADDLSDLG